MNYKDIILAGVVAVGLYLFSQQKKITYKTPDIPPIKKMAEKMAAERLPLDASPTAEKELAEKIYADIMARRAAAAKKIAKKIPEASTPAARKKIAEKKAAAAAAAEKAAEKAAFTPEIKLAIATLSVAEKIQALVAYRKKIAAEKKVLPQSISLTPDMKARVLLEAAIEKAAVRKAAVRKAAVRKAAVRKAAARKKAQKVAQKVASWKAPYKFPNSTFRVITPSDILRKLAKKDIARKKALQQKKVQKTTPSTPSARRKKRLKALYGSHWHDIWVQRQRR